MMRALVIAGILAGGPALALVPLPPCEIEEGGMSVGQLTALGEGKSGVVLESYNNTVRLVGTVYEQQPGPVRALDDFYGVRATHCASGQFLAIKGSYSPDTVAAALGATEFLRANVKAGKAVGFSDLIQAVTAVYGKPITLRETEETCGCQSYFPGLWP
jgi:hypothetical protein